MAQTATPISTLRRSMRSEIRPSGNWMSEPPSTAPAIRRATSAVGEIDLVGVDGAERAEGAVDEADQETADRRDRRIGVEPAEIEAVGLERPRMLGGRERRRQDGEAVEDRADREEEGFGGWRDHHQELAGGRGGEVHHLVDREDGAAVLLRGALVQP